MPALTDNHTAGGQVRALLKELFPDARGGWIRYWIDGESYSERLVVARRELGHVYEQNAPESAVRLSTALYDDKDRTSPRWSQAAGVWVEEYDDLLRAAIRPSLVLIDDDAYQGLWLLDRPHDAWQIEAASRAIAEHVGGHPLVLRGRSLLPLTLPRDGELFKRIGAGGVDAMSPPSDPLPIDEALRGARPEGSTRYALHDLLDLEDKDFQNELQRARVRKKVQDRLRAEASGFDPPSGTHTAAEELALDDVEMQWTVGTLHPTGSNTLLIADFKAGKTTLALNLMKALADKDHFLSRFPTEMTGGRVGYWNYELTETQFRWWLRGLDMANLERATIANIRGRRLPITDPQGMAWAIEWLREHEIVFWILDNFARAHVGGENDNDAVKQFLDALDEIKRRAGVLDLVLLAHTPRLLLEPGKERARGATRLDDWADNRWILSREEHDRFLRADGRDVSFDEHALQFDPATRALTLVSGERTDRRAVRRTRAIDEARESIKLALGEKPGISATALRAALRVKDQIYFDARRELIASGEIVEVRIGQSVRFYLAEDQPT